MDYRALAELIMMSLVGLSLLTIAAGLSFRLFLAPVVREVLDRMGPRGEAEPLQVLGRLEALEDRLDGIEAGIDRIAAASEFDRSLEAPRDPGSTVLR